jgi:hypothetical protein
MSAISKARDDDVVLHQLCDRCKSFFDGWDFLTWAKDRLYNDPPSRRLHFSIVAQLLRSRNSCHMCEMVLSWLNCSNGDPNRPIYFIIGVIGPYEPDFLPIDLSVGNSPRRHRWASLYLRYFDGKSVSPNSQ